MIQNLSESEHFSVYESIQDVMNQTLTRKFHPFLTSKTVNGIPSGFTALDEQTHGFHPAEVTTFAVRPGVGKTAFMLSLVNNIGILDGKKVGLFSAERPSKKIVQRLLESATGMSVNKINATGLSDAQETHLELVVNAFRRSNIIIDDTNTPSVEYIVEKTKLMVEKYGIQIVLIDYLELLVTPTMLEGCEEELCTVMKLLNKMSRDLNIPVIIFSQLSKPVLYPNAYKYTPDHVNFNTDSLIFVNRPDFYHINEIDQKEKGIAELTVAKHPWLKEPEMISLRFVESSDRYRNLN